MRSDQTYMDFKIAHLLKEGLGSLEVLDVLIQTWFTLLQRILEVTKETRVSQDVIKARLEAVFEQRFHVALCT